MARMQQRLSSQWTRVVWIIAVILGLLAILLHYHVLHIAALGRHDFVLLVCAFVLLAATGVARGL
jgi:hypothetical protein